MDAAIAPFYERVRDRLSEAEFTARVREASAAFDGLLDDEAVALFVLDEMGANDGAFVTLADLAGRPDATVRVAIESIEPPREFAREGRPPGRVANCLVSDATAEARLVLWDRDVEKTEDGTLKPGARVTVVNARVKESRWGIELHAGPWTAIEVEGAPTPAQRKLALDVQADAAPAPTLATLTGTLLAVSPTRTYRQADGRTGFTCDVDIATPQGRVRVVAWDEAVRAARSLKPLSEVVAANVTLKARGAANEWHASDAATFRAA